MAAKSFVVDQPTTLQQLARRHFPGPLRQERFIRWVAEANPELLRGVANLGQHKLLPGVQLLLPSGVPPRRPGDHQNVATAGGPASASADADRGATAATNKQTTLPASSAKNNSSHHDRLVVGTGSGRDLRETMALVERLTGMAEQQMAAQNANNEKIQALETTLAELNRHVAEIDVSARQRESQLRAETAELKKTLTEQSEQGWWQLLVAIVCGGLLGAVLTLFYRRLSAKPTSGLDFFVPEVPAQATDNDSPLTISGTRLDLHVTDDGLVATDTNVNAGPGPSASSFATSAPVKQAATHRAPIEQVEFQPPVSRVVRASSETSPQVNSDTPATSDPATAAIELANIMTSMGLAESAAQTLVEHIRENPRQSLHHWLKLLDLHRLNGSRDEFERSTEELRRYFNVRADDWDNSDTPQRSSLENYSHIRSKLIDLWRKSDCVQFLQSLLMDNREGTRAGFPLPVAEEILLLIAIQSNT
jgi:TolA-binding protein